MAVLVSAWLTGCHCGQSRMWVWCGWGRAQVGLDCVRVARMLDDLQGWEVAMRIGVVFPQTELGGDVGAVRAYAERVEELGFTHVLAYDHVVGADPAVHTRLDGPVRRAHHVPRAVRAVRLPRRGHVARAGHRDHHPAAAPDRARRQAGRRGRPAHRRAVPARRRASAGTRSSTRRSARTSPTAAGGSSEQIDAAAPAVDRAVGDLRAAASTRSPAPGLAPLPVQRPIPMWIGGQSACRLPPRRAARRRLVPAGAAGPAARRGARRS